jgi:hypothetical protein
VESGFGTHFLIQRLQQASWKWWVGAIVGISNLNKKQLDQKMVENFFIVLPAGRDAGKLNCSSLGRADGV